MDPDTSGTPPATTPEDVPGEVDVNFGSLVEKMDAWLDGFIAMLPNIAVAIVFFLIMYGVSVLVQKAIKRAADSRDRPSLGTVGGNLVGWIIVVVGVLFAITIVAPSIKPADLLAGLGIGSVAIGFAFKDILENLLAGILLLIRQPFSVGDQIRSGDHEGTVERIETRATIIKTYSGKRAVVPNSQIYTNPVVVLTAHPQIRSQYDVGIGYGDDIDAAAEAMKKAMSGIEGVLSDPAPEVIVWELAGSSVNLRARWWTQSRRADVVHTYGRVLTAIKKELDQQSIDMPYPTNVVLWHNQTEETDGDRTQQREGWPAGDSPPKPRPLAGSFGSDGGAEPEPRQAQSS